jgi:hypothetical protein
LGFSQRDRWTDSRNLARSPALGCAYSLEAPGRLRDTFIKAYDVDSLGEAGADAFTIMRIAGHSSVTVSQRYVHPTPEWLERAFERLENLNAQKFEAAANEQVSRNVVGIVSGIPTAERTFGNRRKLLK